MLHLKHMGNTLTIRLSAELAGWLEARAKQSGVSKGEVVRRQLEKAREGSPKPWAHLVGDLEGLPRDLSMRRGFSRK